MSCKEGIIAGIIYHVVTSDRPEFCLWRIVLTDDVRATYAERGRPDHFFSWQPESGGEAQTIGTYFVLGKGMIGNIAGEFDCGKTTSVCVFPCAEAPILSAPAGAVHSSENVQLR